MKYINKMSQNITVVKLHSWHIIILLILVLTFGSIILGLLIKQNLYTNAFDDYLYEAIHKGPHSKIFDILIKPFNFNFLPDQYSPLRMPSYYYFMFIGTLIYSSLYKRSQVAWVVFCFAVGTLLAYAVTAIDWIYVFRERPFVKLPNDVDAIGKQAWQQLSSYPSGHARETTLYSVLMYNFIPKIKWVMIIFVIFIAYSRVYIGAHYPTDVIAAVMIGYLTAKITLMVARELQIILDKRKGVEHAKKPKGSRSDLIQS